MATVFRFRAKVDNAAYTIAMRLFFLLAAATVETRSSRCATRQLLFAEQRSSGGRTIRYAVAGQRHRGSEPRLDAIGNRLAAHSPQFNYRFLAFDGGKPSQDTAPAAAFPADWRRLDLDEAIAVAGGTIFVPRRLLSRDDAQLTAILAHAMGHVALRHPTAGMTRGELAQVEVQAASRTMPERLRRT